MVEPQAVIHARHEGANLCGQPGPSLEGWSGTVVEITCPDCNARILTFTADGLNAGIDPALRQPRRSERSRS